MVNSSKLILQSWAYFSTHEDKFFEFITSLRLLPGPDYVQQTQTLAKKHKAYIGRWQAPIGHNMFDQDIQILNVTANNSHLWLV